MSVRVANYAKASDVRAWAEANGFEVGARGKFSTELIKAFNKGGGLKYAPGKWERTVSVTGRNENGKKVTRKVSVRQARAALVAAGGNPRGRIKTADLASTIGLTVDPAPVSEAAKLRAKLAAAGVTVGRRGRLSADQLEAAKSL